MSKIVELNLTETKAVVGGVAVAASLVSIPRIPTGTMNMPPVSLPAGQNAPPAHPKLI
jgi:hypothetical protein